MKILVDILHPAHVHFFRDAISRWKDRHEVLVTSRDKDITLELLDEFGIDNVCISKQGRGVFGLCSELIRRDARLYRIASGFVPDVMTGIAGVSISHVGKFIKKPSIVFYDTETAALSNAVTYPFASVICTPDCYEGKAGKINIRYPGYQELSYLHPSRFKPDESILEAAGVGGKSFFILRFVSWEAAHDLGRPGLSLKDKLDLVKMLGAYGQVLISSERELPPSLKTLGINTRYKDIHHLMSYALLTIGESATMASESAMLGVPAIYIDDIGRGYTRELEKKYGLVYNFRRDEPDKIHPFCRELIEKDPVLLKKEWANKRDVMLDATIDVSDFVSSFVEEYKGDAGIARDIIEKARKVR